MKPVKPIPELFNFAAIFVRHELANVLACIVDALVQRYLVGVGCPNLTIECLCLSKCLQQALRRFVWKLTLTISGRSRARWACGQGAFEPVHMSTGLYLGDRL